MSVEFQDFSIEVKEVLDDAVIAYLYEAAGEVESQTKRNMPNGEWYNQQKDAWEYRVDESKKEAVVGNPLEAALWTEFGTGEYALNKNGRKGYWVYVKDSLTDKKSRSSKIYTLTEALLTVQYLRRKGLDAHCTKGKRAIRPLFNAFTLLKPALIKRAEEVLKGRLK